MINIPFILLGHKHRRKAQSNIRQIEKPKYEPVPIDSSKYLVCDNPLVGPETYILHTEKGFLLRVSDMAIYKGGASPQDKKEAKAWYCSYLQFIEQ